MRDFDTISGRGTGSFPSKRRERTQTILAFRPVRGFNQRGAMMAA
jgi:hypothetical protein